MTIQPKNGKSLSVREQFYQVGWYGSPNRILIFDQDIFRHFEHYKSANGSDLFTAMGRADSKPKIEKKTFAIILSDFEITLRLDSKQKKVKIVFRIYIKKSPFLSSEMSRRSSPCLWSKATGSSPCTTTLETPNPSKCLLPRRSR